MGGIGAPFSRILLRMGFVWYTVLFPSRVLLRWRDRCRVGCGNAAAVSFLVVRSVVWPRECGYERARESSPARGVELALVVSSTGRGVKSLALCALETDGGLRHAWAVKKVGSWAGPIFCGWRSLFAIFFSFLLYGAELTCSINFADFCCSPDWMLISTCQSIFLQDVITDAFSRTQLAGLWTRVFLGTHNRG